jgi:leucyl aminopeptidase
MLACYTKNLESKVIPIIPILEKELEKWLKEEDVRTRNWIATIAFKAKPGTVALQINVDGDIERVIVGIADKNDFWIYGQLATTLPKGVYKLHASITPQEFYLAALMWGLGAYQFTLYKKIPPYEAKLLINDLDEGLAKKLECLVSSTYLVRDLINTPTDDMGPAELAEAAVRIGEEFGAKTQQIIGDELLKQNFPTIHTVGRACDHEPRLIDMRWGNEAHPKVTLVGKGVCFDTGGLDIKPAAGMALMKKDMAGAAHALGLARLIMATKIPVCLRVLIPALENSVSGGSFHPGDVITTRKGTTVEVTNTDAEGRLVLCDALAEAVSENPELLIDFSTLTGAARVALGTDIAAVFTPDDQLAEDLMHYGKREMDLIWRLPLYMPYRKLLDSPIADIANAAFSPFGGAITAAVYLKEFVPDTIKWAHFDMMAWNETSRPARPLGGEANAIRAVYSYIVDKFGDKK